jgi:hypothetical protein
MGDMQDGCTRLETNSFFHGLLNCFRYQSHHGVKGANEQLSQVSNDELWTRRYERIAIASTMLVRYISYLSYLRSQVETKVASA